MAVVAIMFLPHNAPPKKAFTQECLWAQSASVPEVDVPSLNLCGQCSVARSLFDAPIKSVGPEDVRPPSNRAFSVDAFWLVLATEEHKEAVPVVLVHPSVEQGVDKC